MKRWFREFSAFKIDGCSEVRTFWHIVLPMLKAEEFVSAGKFSEARKIQHDINDIIIALCSLNGSMYAVIKEILKLRGVNIGSVRGPLKPVSGEDFEKNEGIKTRIDEVIMKYQTGN